MNLYSTFYPNTNGIKWSSSAPKIFKKNIHTIAIVQLNLLWYTDCSNFFFILYRCERYGFYLIAAIEDVWSDDKKNPSVRKARKKNNTKIHSAYIRIVVNMPCHCLTLLLVVFICTMRLSFLFYMFTLYFWLSPPGIFDHFTEPPYTLARLLACLLV